MLMQTTPRALLLTILFSYPLLHCALQARQVSRLSAIHVVGCPVCRLVAHQLILPTPCQVRDDRLTGVRAARTLGA